MARLFQFQNSAKLEIVSSRLSSPLFLFVTVTLYMYSLNSLKIRHAVPPRRRLPLLGPSGLCDNTSLSCASSLSLST